MRDFQIITDTNSDLPKEYVIEKGLLQVPQYTLLQGVTYEGAEGIDPADFYNKMKAGEEPQSQAINPAVTEEKFREALDAGKDVLYISFASTLSGSYNTAAMTAQNLSEEYPDAKIITVDTLAASSNEERTTVEDVYEPYLIQLGFIARTPRGRIATKLAYEHMGYKYDKGDNDEE